MQPTIVKTSKSELLMVEVLEEPVEGVYRFTHQRIYYVCKTGEWFCSDVLPEGEWQLIGLLKDITEEVAAGLVDKDEVIGYKDYEIEYRSCLSPITSLKSLASSHGLTGNIVVLKKVEGDA